MDEIAELLMKHRPITRALGCLLLSAVLNAVTGCSADRDDHETSNRHQQPSESADDVGVTLTAEEIQNAGIETQTIEPATYAPRARGFAVVIAHDLVAQSVSEVITAQAGAEQSRVALNRIEGLAKTPGAFSAETLEGARRQAQADEAAYVLARRKLSASWGAQSPWGEDAHNETLTKIASGQLQLVRVTFPFGILNGPAPRQLTFSSLGSQDAAAAVTSSSIWNAPADAAIPGRSLLALVTGSSFSEGERVDVSAPVGSAVSGAIVPSAAVVLYDAQAWCYIEDAPGRFERRAIDTRLEASTGYFSETTIKPGDRVVVAGAALLLAREINPNTDADD